MANTSEATTEPSLAKTLAPEEVRPGDYLAVLDEVIEYPSFLWGCESPLVSERQVVRLRYHARGAGLPLLVQQVCLPFVFVQAPGEKPRTLDLRDCRVARLNAGYGKAVSQALSKKGTDAGKRKRNKKQASK